MPISHQSYRSQVGNYVSSSYKNIKNQSEQQALLNDLANHRGDAEKRMRAETVLQLALLISNISLAVGETFVRPQGGSVRKSRSLTGLAKPPYSPSTKESKENGIFAGITHSRLSEDFSRCRCGPEKEKSSGRKTSLPSMMDNATIAISEKSSPENAFLSANMTAASEEQRNDEEDKQLTRQTERIKRFFKKNVVK
ncbi:hypothetical protein ABK905_02720 [Acerihabitans sp. KWT182]|uniref:Uncharacterized protein n=1 Tax=Acerihabitans sp. KWT182 TaxID=3157919 RepID=A0AAU7QC40_9GAMM